ncbi:MAG TPA: putative LPS assembly protein LptD [Longimicrobiales bacterium]
MGARYHVMRAATLLALALAIAAAPAAAQDRAKPSGRPAAKDVRERVLNKLRALERAGRPRVDSAAAVAGDSPARGAAAAAPTADGAAAARTPGGDARAGGAAGAGRVGATRPAAGGVSPPGVAADAPAGGLAAGPGRVPVIVHVPPDSLAAALRDLEGYALTEYTAAESARFAADSGRLELIGSPSLSRQGQGIHADSLLVYNEPKAILCGYGKPVLEGTRGEPVESEQVCYNIDREVGVALGARTQFTENATWFVHGEELYTKGNDRIYGANTNFTSCDLETPHYHFAAKSVKIVHDEILVARDVTLTFQDVPVFWLPFMVQSMKQGRRSGLLTPDFQLTDIVRNRSGYDRRISNIGFYWSVNDYLGAKVAMDWWSDHWLALNGMFQYNWKRQFLNGNVDLTRYWKDDGSTELSLRTNHRWQPGERTSVSISANFQSSEFVEEFSYDPRQLDRSIQSNAGLSHRFDWGSLNVSANRTQYLTDARTTMTLPSVSLNFTPVTLFEAAGEPSWYNNATWSGSISFTDQSSELNELLPGATNRDSRQRSASVSSSFSLGNLSLSQSAQFREDIHGAKPRIPDPKNPVAIVDTALSLEVSRLLDWNTSIGYSQRLIGTSTFNPRLSLRGQIADSDGMEPVPGPTRISFGASLNTNIYGFWPGFGPFSRLRHRIDPRLSYDYSPVPEVTERQVAIFGEQAGRETNRLSLSINQTWEAKYASEDTAAAAADTAATGAPGEPRRLPQSKKITLLSLTTNALVYDFALAKEGDYGFRTTDISHSIRSDLLEGLDLSIGYDLFRIEEGADGEREVRTFSPRLRRVNASFSLDSNSWLFRVLGLGAAIEDADTTAVDSAAAGPAGAVAGAGDLGNPFMGPNDIDTRSRQMGTVGSWRANLDYSLVRPAAGAEGAEGNQLLRGSISFQPTEHWNVSWRTSYSFTDGEFEDHILTFSRDIHRWQASFDFVKTRTGNFVFNFRVNLLDNPDLKLEYDERYEGPGAGLR